MIFHTEEVIDKIRECAGAEWKHNQFIHDPSAVKKSKYFSKFLGGQEYLNRGLLQYYSQIYPLVAQIKYYSRH